MEDKLIDVCMSVIYLFGFLAYMIAGNIAGMILCAMFDIEHTIYLAKLIMVIFDKLWYNTIYNTTRCL